MPDSAELLRELLQSPIWAEEFPKRLSRSHREAALHSPRGHLADPSSALARQLVDETQLVDLVRQLEAAGCVEAVPCLAVLWRHSPLERLRTASGQALRKIGTPDAREALIGAIGDSHPSSTRLAVLTLFDVDRRRAWDALIPYFERQRLEEPGGDAIALAVLAVFEPSGFRSDGPVWAESWPPAWLLADRRWIELCVRLRRDPRLGGAARNVLRHVPRDVADEALRKALEEEGPALIARRTHAVGDLLARYRSGRHREVWETLRAFGPIDGDLRLEADAVAGETMRRVAHNIDLLAGRLSAFGWRPLTGEFRSRPGPEDVNLIQQAESLTGAPLPASLLAFWKIVGGVDFVWDYNLDDDAPQLAAGIDLAAQDPLFVDPALRLKDSLEEWETVLRTTHPELIDPFIVDVAPDDLHKVNVSGGGPYGFHLPFYGADPLFRDEPHELPFVDYLRLCLQWGGFPGLERRGSSAEVIALVSRLTEGFEPF